MAIYESGKPHPNIADILMNTDKPIYYSYTDTTDAYDPRTHKRRIRWARIYGRRATQFCMFVDYDTWSLEVCDDYVHLHLKKLRKDDADV